MNATQPNPPPRSLWRRWWTWAAIAAAAVVILVAAALWSLSRRGPLHDYVLKKVQQQASQALGGAVQIGGYRLHLSLAAPSLDMDNLRIQGTGPASAPPLATIRHLRASIGVDSLLHGQWHLQDIEADAPVVHLQVAADGRTNLPAIAGGGPTPFDLGVRHLVVRDGEIYFNDQARRLTADLHGFHFQSSFDAAARQYRGTLGYSSGTATWTEFAPLPSSLALDFAADPAGLSISNLRLQSDGTSVTATAQLRGWSNPVLAARYQVQLNAAELRALLHQPFTPTGLIAITGTADYAPSGLERGEAAPGPAPNKASAPANALRLAGHFQAARLDVAAQGLQVPIENLRGTYHLAGGTLVVEPIQARVLGGAITATVHMTGVGESGPGGERANLTARLTGGQLGTLVRAAGQHQAAQTLATLGVTGTVTAITTASWHGGLNDVRLQTDAQVAATLAPDGRPPLPLKVAASVGLAGGQLTLRSAQLNMPATTAELSGKLGGGGTLQILVRSGDLGQLEQLANSVAAAFGTHLPAIGLGGAGVVNATLSGALTSPAIAGSLALTPLLVRGTSWKHLGVDFNLSSTAVVLRNGVLESGDQGSRRPGLTGPRAGASPSGMPGAAGQGPAPVNGRVSFQASVGLDHWRLAPGAPLQASLQASGITLQPVARAARQNLPLSGILSGDLQVAGTARQPTARGSLRLSAASVTLAGVRQPLQAINVGLQSSGSVLQAQVQVDTPAGRITASGSYDTASGRYQATLSAPQLELSRFALVAARKLPLQGAITLAGSGQGTLAAPAFALTLTAPGLRADGQTISAIRLQTQLASNAVQVQLAATALNTALAGQAHITLNDNWPVQATLDAPAVPFAPLLVAFAPGLAAQLQGRTAIHATVAGPLRNPKALTASVVLPTLDLSFLPGQLVAPSLPGAAPPAIHLVSTAPIQVHMSAGVVTLAPVELRGADTDLHLSGRLPLNGGAISLAATGTVDLKLAQLWAPDVATAGEVTLNLQAAGPLAAPAFTGEVQIHNGSLATRNLPLGVQNLQGSLRLHDGRLDIASLHATVGGGSLAATGGIALQPNVRFDLALQARAIRLLFPPTLREALSADLTFSGTLEQSLLAGRVRVESVSTTPQFDFATFISQVAQNPATVAAPGSFLENLALNVNVTTPNQIRITSPAFSVQAGANVTIRGNALAPVALGRVTLASGDLIFRGNRYVIQSGTLDFVNPTRTEPTVNITADATIQQYNLHLRFQGSADNLRTAYTSDPALPPADIINLLAFGQTTESSAANSVPGNLGAENLIASAVSSQITDRVQKIAGISQLSVDPVLGGNQQNTGARVTIQQRVTGSLFVTISTDVTSTQRDVIEIRYQLSPRVSVSAVRDQNGGIGLNTRFKKIW
ncbi:MAG: translocation/assembly module TamB domain-containing protein [Terriglobales bacterium]